MTVESPGGRITPRRHGAAIPYPVAAGAAIGSGSIVAANANGYAVPGSASADLAILGRAEEGVDNALGPDGGATVLVSMDGEFQWLSLTADPILPAHIGRTCWIADHESVAGSDGGGARSVAGIVTGVATEAGVSRAWVRPGPASSAAPPSPDSAYLEVSAVLDAAAIRGLFASPHVVVPAPGAGKSIAVEEVRVSKRGDTPIGAGRTYVAITVKLSQADSRLALYLVQQAFDTELFYDGDRDRVDTPGGAVGNGYLLAENQPLTVGGFAVAVPPQTAEQVWDAKMAPIAGVTLEFTVRHRVVSLRA